MRMRSFLLAAATGFLALPADAGASNGITIEATSEAWSERVEWGIERFRHAGLALPGLEITVHDDGTTACEGNTGLFHPAATPEVHLCATAAPSSRIARLITLHELAHAWAETQLGDEDRAALLRLRRLDSWVDQGQPPHEWGAEHAAEIVSWGLMDEAVPIIRIYDNEPRDLQAAFHLLVGRAPLFTPSAGRSPSTP